MDDYAWDVRAYDTIARERQAEVMAIREYVSEVWEGAGTYEVEDYDGTRISVCTCEDDLVFDIYDGWHLATARKVG